MEAETAPENPFGYVILRRLSFSSDVYLSREHATERLVVLKYFNEERRTIFENEAKILAELENFRGAPVLHFAGVVSGEDSRRYCLGTRYAAGQSLVELAGRHLEPSEKRDVRRRLIAALRELHDGYGICHGDISPKNVIIRASDHRVTLVDWEFAEKLSRQTLSTFGAYRGTQGFSSVGDKCELIERDNRALEACLKYCDMQTEGEAHSPTSRFLSRLPLWRKSRNNAHDRI